MEVERGRVFLCMKPSSSGSPAVCPIQLSLALSVQDSIRFLRLRAESHNMVFPAYSSSIIDPDASPRMLPVLMTGWLQIGGSNGHPLRFD